MSGAEGRKVAGPRGSQLICDAMCWYFVGMRESAVRLRLQTAAAFAPRCADVFHADFCTCLPNIL